MRVVRQLTGPGFVCAGVMHFVIPKAYRRIMPRARLPLQGVFVAWVLGAMNR